MKPSLAMAIGAVICLGACAKETGTTPGQTASRMGWPQWPRREDEFVSMLKTKQDANMVRLAQQRALEQALEEQASRSQRSERVPPSMYRTTEPPLPEPDLSLPIQDVPRAAPNASPSTQP